MSHMHVADVWASCYSLESLHSRSPGVPVGACPHFLTQLAILCFYCPSTAWSVGRLVPSWLPSFQPTFSCGNWENNGVPIEE